MNKPSERKPKLPRPSYVAKGIVAIQKVRAQRKAKPTVSLENTTGITNESNRVTIQPPVCLMRATVSCWKCRELTPVVRLVVFNLTDEEAGLKYGNAASAPPDSVALQYISDMPYELLDCVRAYQAQFHKRESRTTGETYYQNECHSCSVNIGDFYLFSEPDGPFFLNADSAPVELFRLPVMNAIHMNAGYSFSSAIDKMFSRGVPALKAAV